MAQKQGKGKKEWTPARKSSNAAADAGRKARKERRKATQEAAHRVNKGQGWTPWQRACEARAERRRKARQQDAA